MDYFRRDLRTLMDKLQKGASPLTKEKLLGLTDRLFELRQKNLLKINHSVLEMIVAKHLMEEGYDVDLEYRVDGELTCDVFARKGMGVMIVEVETGYVPPAHALDPVSYIRARISSKISRYSKFCHKFALGAPPHYIMPIPEVLTLPPRYRKKDDLEVIKGYCDMYYSKPPVTREEIVNSHIHSVFVIDVENACIKENDPGGYYDRSQEWYI
ncbi:MAG: hypothetical protein GKC03_02115 [Methanomassiliicoccales archaeon]|nr:hypothetical protein [Methanomassiliicoccales archaeon]NYT15153.1 hypothetical protein [Methanomassiliicoccales archaeon]